MANLFKGSRNPATNWEALYCPLKNVTTTETEYLEGHKVKLLTTS
jgi:hypothetical protein